MIATLTGEEVTLVAMHESEVPTPGSESGAVDRRAAEAGNRSVLRSRRGRAAPRRRAYLGLGCAAVLAARGAALPLLGRWLAAGRALRAAAAHPAEQAGRERGAPA